MVYQCADHYVYEIVKVPFPHTGGGGRQELGVRSEKFSGGHGRACVCAPACAWVRVCVHVWAHYAWVHVWAYVRVCAITRLG